jgi:hypothetical protein
MRQTPSAAPIEQSERQQCASRKTGLGISLGARTVQDLYGIPGPQAINAEESDNGPRISATDLVFSPVSVISQVDDRISTLLSEDTMSENVHPWAGVLGICLPIASGSGT